MSKTTATRSDILKRALELIYKKGFQSTSLDDILATTQVTKGAFYYHFKSKEEMGIALINETIHGVIWPHIAQTISACPDCRNNIYTMIEGLLYEQAFLTTEYGCPVVNLIQEMAPLSEAFRTALNHSVNIWTTAIETEIIKGQQAGQLSQRHDAGQIALYLIALYHGVRNMGKIPGRSYYASFMNELRNYLDSLD